MSTSTPDSTARDQMVAERTVDVPPQAVFALLTDPTRHQETEPTDWVRDAIDTQQITRLGQVFGIEMFHVEAGGHYEIHNEVIALDRDRVVAWRPGQFDENGALGAGGWTWRYDLAPEGGGTRVALTYDWSAVPQEVRDEFGGLPPFPPEFLDQSLRSLAAALRGPVA